MNCSDTKHRSTGSHSVRGGTDKCGPTLGAGAEFSALTVCAGTKRIIVYNPSQPRGRKANSLAHELSHVILEHPASPTLDATGCRRWDGVLEAEADWLAGVLLVPREGALLWMMKNGSAAEGAAHFGVEWSTLHLAREPDGRRQTTHVPT